MKEIKLLIQNISKKLDAKTIANCFSIANMLENHYYTLVYSKKITPIEKLQEEEKRELWKVAQEIKQGSKQEKIDYCKALYTLIYYQSKME